MCWQDIFTGQNNQDGNNSTERGELIVNKYNNAIHLWELIDWSTWWFHHSHKNEWTNQYGGLKEWCVDNGIELEPDGHPTNKGHEMFYKELASKWIYE